MQFSIIQFLCLVPVYSFDILKQYLEPGYDSPMRNAKTCNVSPGLKILFRSVYINVIRSELV